MNDPAASYAIGQPQFRPAITGPRTFGEILDRAFQLLRRNWRLFCAIGTVPGCVFLAVYVVFLGGLGLLGFFAHPGQPQDPALMFRFLGPMMLIVALPVLAVFSLYIAAACHAATQADTGSKATFRQSYALAWAHAGRHILLLLWIYARAFLPALVIAAVLFGGAFVLRSFKLTGPGFFLAAPLAFVAYLAAYIYGFVVAMRLSLAFPACVVEGLTAGQAIRRSSVLTRGAKGRIFLMLLVIYVISYAALMVCYLVSLVFGGIGIFAVSILGVQPSPVFVWIGVGLLAVCVVGIIFLFMTLTWGAMTTALAVIYHDQRVRIEGYDIERLMHAAGLAAPLDAQSLPAESSLPPLPIEPA